MVGNLAVHGKFVIPGNCMWRRPNKNARKLSGARPRSPRTLGSLHHSLRHPSWWVGVAVPQEPLYCSWVAVWVSSFGLTRLTFCPPPQSSVGIDSSGCLYLLCSRRHIHCLDCVCLASLCGALICVSTSGSALNDTLRSTVFCLWVRCAELLLCRSCSGFILST